jgi:hypothetical protein
VEEPEDERQQLAHELADPATPPDPGGGVLQLAQAAGSGVTVLVNTT